MAETKDKKGILVKVLFVIGIIVLVCILAFAVFKIAPKIFSGMAAVGQFIASPFSDKNIKISSSDYDIKNNDKVILSWKHSNDGNGNYFISYSDCPPELNLQIISELGNVNLLCDKPYNLRELKSVEMVVSSKKENIYLDFSIDIEYVENETRTVLASGSVDLGIANQIDNSNDQYNTDDDYNADNKKPVTTNIPVKTTPAKTVNTYVNYGPADLAISNARALNNNSVTFTIYNIGGNPTGSWSFDYIDTHGVTKSAPAQISLSSGQGLQFTLTLENQKQGNVIIVIDPRNSISESNRLNNTEIIAITGGGSSSSSGSYNANDDEDLTITSIQVGRLSGSRFTSDDEIDEDDEAAVKFIVKNIGGKSTGDWRFEITNLPYDNDDDYRSGRQDSLRPGESREIIVGFDSPDEGRYTIRVEVDSEDDVDEENERNNTKTDRLEVRD